MTRRPNAKRAEGAPNPGTSEHALTRTVPATAAVTSAAGQATAPVEWLSSAGARLGDLAGRVTDAAAALVSVRSLMVTAAALTVLACVVLGARLVTTRRSLAPGRRLRMMALPTESFDPSAEEIDRYAAQLSRTRRTVRSALSRPAQAVRVRLDSVGDGRAVYRIEGLADAGSILRLSGYREVELRPADAIDEEAMRSLVEVAPGEDTDSATGDEEGPDAGAAGDEPDSEDQDRQADAAAGRRPGPGREGRRR